MNLEFIFITCISVLVHIQSGKVIASSDEDSVETTFTWDGPVPDPEGDEEEREYREKAITYLQQFGEQFNDYFHPTIHTLIGENVELYKAVPESKTVKYERLKNRKYLQSFINPYSDDIVAEDNDQQFNGVPNVIYPRLSVIVDHKYFKKFDGDIEEIVKYVINFWNLVDLSFRPFNSPKIRLNIARIIIATSKLATPYISRNLLKKVNTAKSIEAMENLVIYDEILNHRNDNTSTFIYHMSMVPLATYAVRSHASSTCKFDLAIVRDRADYSGVTPAAYGLRNMLGLINYDLKYKCKCNHRSIIDYDQYGPLYTPEAVEVIRNYLRMGTGRCYFNLPNVGKPLKLELAGFTFNHKEQCQAIYGQKALPNLNKFGQDRCEKLLCKDHTVKKCFPYKPLDGTFCGDIDGRNRRICIKGKCILTP